MDEDLRALVWDLEKLINAHSFPVLLTPMSWHGQDVVDIHCINYLNSQEFLKSQTYNEPRSR